MAGKLFKQSTGFTQVTNHVINDPDLSWKAKGIYTYLVSKPDEWDFYMADIIKRAKEGETAVQSGIKELEDSGYLVRKPRHDEEGKFCGNDYYIYNEPISVEDRQPENPVVGETTHHSNTNKQSNTDHKETKAKKEAKDDFLKKLLGENNNVVGQPSYTFEQFWDDYGYKTGKAPSSTHWSKLKKTDVEAIRLHLPSYLGATSTADGKPHFRKKPEKYLKERMWEDEQLPVYSNSTGTSLQQANFGNNNGDGTQRYNDY